VFQSTLALSGLTIQWVVAAAPKVKGIAFRSIELCFTERYGPAARERANEHLPARLAENFRLHLLLATSWYPIDEYKACLQAFRAAAGGGADVAREIGRLAARHDMAQVHKQLLARLISPGALLSLSQRVFNNYYDTGRFEILESQRGFVRAQARGCAGWDENMWTELAGSSESLLEIAGAKHVRLRIVNGGRDGDQGAEFEARWV
jgi:hypothetical protein